MAITFPNCLDAATAGYHAPSRPLFMSKEEYYDVNSESSRYVKERLAINEFRKRDKPQLSRPLKKQKDCCKLFWPNEHQKKRLKNHKKSSHLLNLKRN